MTICVPRRHERRRRQTAARAAPRAAAALRRHRERDLLGRDERARARSRSSASRRGRSPSRATTTRSLLVDDLEPGSVTPYDVRLDGELGLAARRRPPGAGRPHARSRAAACGSSSARAGSAVPSPTSRRGLAGGARRSTGVDALWTYAQAAPARRGRMARRAPAPRRPGVRGRGLARRRSSSSAHGATRARHPARRSPTSRSTRASTARRGPSPTSAGCSRPCRAR